VSIVSALTLPSCHVSSDFICGCRQIAQDMADVWVEGQPLAVAAAELADHIPLLEMLLVGEASEEQLASAPAAMRAALLALAPLGFEAALGLTPATRLDRV